MGRKMLLFVFVLGFSPLSFSQVIEKPQTLSDVRVTRIEPYKKGELKIPFYVVTDVSKTRDELKLESLNLQTQDDFKNLVSQINKQLELSKAQNQEKQTIEATGAKFDEPKFFISKKKTEVLKETLKLANFIAENFNSQDNSQKNENYDALTHLLEMTVAFNNSYRYPLPKYEALGVPLMVFNSVLDPLVAGQSVAVNVPGLNKNKSDEGRLDPVASTIWQRPNDLKKRNLYYGFGRDKIPDFSKSVCVYNEPKDGFGTHPGMVVKCGDKKVKVKFGEEVSTAPFNSRIYWALGFNTNPVDYLDGLKLKYSRKIFTEFNSRRDLIIQLQALGFINIKDINIQHEFDPFNYVKEVLMKDGSRLSGLDFKQKVLINQDDKSYRLESNYNADVENQVENITLVQTGVALDLDKDTINVGSWDFDSLDHPNRRELRGSQLLSAWVANYDVRWENTRLYMIDTPQGKALKHVFSDVGSGLGAAATVWATHGAQPNRLGWTFTEMQSTQAQLKEGQVLQLVGFDLYMGNKTMASVSLDDARWMTRLIGGLTEGQILSALVASGMSAADIKLTLEKLISRRDKLVQDFNLEGELGLLRPVKIDRKFSYDPQVTPISIVVDGVERVAQDKGTVVRDGKVVER